MNKNSKRGFFATTVARPVGLLVIFITLVVIGVISYVRIPLQMLPGGFQATRYGVWVQHPRSSAAENEEKVARVLEDQFRTLPDLDDVFSRSSDDSVYIRVAFNGQANLELAKAELRDRIERARPLLPETVDRINVWSNDDGDPPIMFFAILIPERTQDIDWLIENRVQARLEAVDGVSRAQVWGMLADSIRILLDEDKVKAARLDIGALIRRLSSDNFTQPLGEVNDGGRRFLLRSDMRFGSLEEVENYPVGDGVRIRDIASVERVKSVRERLTRIDGQDAYYGMLQKEATANIVEVSGRVHEALAEIQADPDMAGLGIEIFFDQAKFIEGSLDRLTQTALYGGLLAIGVLFLFLRRFRMTLVVALSIPVSAMLSIAWEFFTGGSFNVLTMTGLTLGLGMLVDNSVVVIENIARLHREGHSPREAAVLGVRDVGLAVALATMTTVVVFLPLIFMGNHPQLRIMLTALGIPLCTSLLFSLLVALVFLPVIAARILGDRPRWIERASVAIGPLTRVPVRASATVLGSVRRLAHGAMTLLFHLVRLALRILTPLRWLLAAGIVALVLLRFADLAGVQQLANETEALGLDLSLYGRSLGAGGSAVALGIVGILVLLVGLPRWRRRPRAAPLPPARFTPRGDSILEWLQDGSRVLLGWTLRHRLLAFVFSVMAFATVSIPMGNMAITSFGEDEDLASLEIDVDLEDNFTLPETSDEFWRYEQFLEQYREQFGYARLVSRFGAGGGELELRWEERQDPELLEDYRNRLREEMPRYAGHSLRFSREQQIGEATRNHVWFQLRGPNAEALEKYGKEAVEVLRGVDGLLDVSSSLEASPEQVRLIFDDDAAHEYGVTSENALRNVAWALRGANLPRFQEDGREVPFLMEYNEENLAGLDTLRNLDIFTGTGTVPLSAFATIEFARGAREIYRFNGQTTFSIQARIDDPARQGQLITTGYDALEALELPRGFSLGRDSSVLVQSEEELEELQKAFALGVVLVFLLMAILFESFVLPWSVLTTVPFAFAGALWTLYLTDTVMDSVGWIGIIILAGVVVNNGIVLIDKIHRMRLVDGLPRDQAVVEGAAARVRPILMTALTTIFGLLPMALGPAARDGIDYRALATCVAGGLTLSTFFCLWVVPLWYTLFDDLGRMVRWVFGRAISAGPLQVPPADEPRAGAGFSAALQDRA